MVNNEAELPEHVRRNRVHWDAHAAEYVGPGERAWARQEPTWGIWRVPDSALRVLPQDLTGKDVIELGCGTAYIAAWLARRGARVVGIDTSAAQLATTRRLQREHGLSFTLIHGNAEQVPYPDASFDLAISEYGACLWADPYRWVPEAARLLRPGGALIFLVHAPENTLAAFDLALQMGVRHIELDVHLTSDGHIVVIHDDTIDRTTNGSGPVTSHTLAALRALDAGSWFGAKCAGERIPTFHEVLARYKGRVHLHPEIKGRSPSLSQRTADLIHTWHGGAGHHYLVPKCTAAGDTGLCSRIAHGVACW